MKVEGPFPKYSVPSSVRPLLSSSFLRLVAAAVPGPKPSSSPARNPSLRLERGGGIRQGALFRQDRRCRPSPPPAAPPRPRPPSTPRWTRTPPVDRDGRKRRPTSASRSATSPTSPLQLQGGGPPLGRSRHTLPPARYVLTPPLLVRVSGIVSTIGEFHAERNSFRFSRTQYSFPVSLVSF